MGKYPGTVIETTEYTLEHMGQPQARPIAEIIDEFRELVRLNLPVDPDEKKALSRIVRELQRLHGRALSNDDEKAVGRALRLSETLLERIEHPKGVERVEPGVELSRERVDGILRDLGCPEEVFQEPTKAEKDAGAMTANEKRRSWLVGYMGYQMLNLEKASGEFIGSTPNSFQIPSGDESIKGATLAKAFSAFDRGISEGTSEQLRANFDMMSDILAKGKAYFDIRGDRSALASFYLGDTGRFDPGNFKLYDLFPKTYYQVGGEWILDEAAFSERFLWAWQRIRAAAPLAVDNLRSDGTIDERFPKKNITNQDSLFPSFGEGIGWNVADYEAKIAEYVTDIGRPVGDQLNHPELCTPEACQARGRFALMLAYNLHAFGGTGWDQDAGPNPALTTRASGFISTEYMTRIHHYREYGLKLLREGPNAATVSVGKTNKIAVERFRSLIDPIWDFHTVDGMRLGDKLATAQHWSEVEKGKLPLDFGQGFGKAVEAAVLVFDIINEHGFFKGKRWSSIKQQVPGSENDYAYDPDLADETENVFRNAVHYFVERDNCKRYNPGDPPPSPDYILVELTTMETDSRGRPILDASGRMVPARDPATGQPKEKEKWWTRYHRRALLTQNDINTPATAEVNALKRTQMRHLLIADLGRGDNVNIRQNDIDAIGQLLSLEVREKFERMRRGKGVVGLVQGLLTAEIPKIEGLNVFTELQFLQTLKAAGVSFNIGRVLRDLGSEFKSFQ